MFTAYTNSTSSTNKRLYLFTNDATGISTPNFQDVFSEPITSVQNKFLQIKQMRDLNTKKSLSTMNPTPLFHIMVWYVSLLQSDNQMTIAEKSNKEIQLIEADMLLKKTQRSVGLYKHEAPI